MVFIVTLRFSMSAKSFLSTHSSFVETARNQVESSQGCVADGPQWMCLFMLKALTPEDKNVPPHCCGEESITNLSTGLTACTSWHQLDFSTPPHRMSE
jgi:hypothetical protein